MWGKCVSWRGVVRCPWQVALLHPLVARRCTRSMAVRTPQSLPSIAENDPKANVCHPRSAGWWQA